MQLTVAASWERFNLGSRRRSEVRKAGRASLADWNTAPSPALVIPSFCRDLKLYTVLIVRLGASNHQMRVGARHIDANGGVGYVHCAAPQV